MSPSAFLTCVLTAAALPAAFCTDSVSDPVRDYVLDFETRNDEQILVSAIDLNGDAVDDLLISRTSLANGRQGNIWVLYESLPEGGFRRLDELEGGGALEFHRLAVSFRPRSSPPGYDLVRYSPGSASSGFVSTFSLGPDGIRESLGREIRPGGADAAYYASTFDNPDTRLRFELRDARELRAQYLPFGGWFRGMSFAKWAIVSLAGLLLLLLVLNLLRLLRRPRRIA